MGGSAARAQAFSTKDEGRERRSKQPTKQKDPETGPELFCFCVSVVVVFGLGVKGFSYTVPIYPKLSEHQNQKTQRPKDKLKATKNQTNNKTQKKSSSGILSGSLDFWSQAWGLKPREHRPTRHANINAVPAGSKLFLWLFVFG